MKLEDENGLFGSESSDDHLTAEAETQILCASTNNFEVLLVVDRSEISQLQVEDTTVPEKERKKQQKVRKVPSWDPKNPNSKLDSYFNHFVHNKFL